jgi:hypothetical protein
MKRVISVSLGSSKRNHQVEVDFNGTKFSVERRGTDGDMGKMISTIRELDGQVDAFGLGGIDLYVGSGKRRYVIKDGLRIVRAATKTPIVDGSGLKNTLERRTIQHLIQGGWDFQGKKVLLVSALDRWGMAESLHQAGCQLVIGDLMFVLGIPMPIRSLKTIQVVAAFLAPLVTKLPFSILYPTGKKQEVSDGKLGRYFRNVDIIAGDFNYIYKHMPMNMEGKILITNTVTSQDVEELRKRGVKTLVTTTPVLNGRSFGTNVMEAVLLAYVGEKGELSPDQYNRLLDELNLVPRVEHL